MAEAMAETSAAARSGKALVSRNLALGGSLVLTMAAVLQVVANQWHAMTASSHSVDSSAAVIAYVPRTEEPWLDPKKTLRDFAYLHDRLMEEFGWDQSRSEAAIVEYLRFLTMLAESPRMELVPPTDLDLVWHEHIQDTLNYAEDCRDLFGRFLHHRRARTSEEMVAIPESYVRTKRHYADRFGNEPSPQFWGTTTEATSMCGGGPPLLAPKPTPAPTTTTTTTTTASTSTASTSTATTATTSPPPDTPTITTTVTLSMENCTIVNAYFNSTAFHNATVHALAATMSCCSAADIEAVMSKRGCRRLQESDPYSRRLSTYGLDVNCTITSPLGTTSSQASSYSAALGQVNGTTIVWNLGSYLAEVGISTNPVSSASVSTPIVSFPGGNPTTATTSGQQVNGAVGSHTAIALLSAFMIVGFR